MFLRECRRRTASGWFEHDMKSGWARLPHALSPDTVEVVRSALEGGWVFGNHYHFAGACGPDGVVFETYEGYREHIDRSRPGDKFLLWSVAGLIGQGLQLSVRPAHSSKSADIAKIRAYLSQVPGPQECANEVFVVARLVTAAQATGFFTDVDGLDKIELLFDECDALGGKLYVFPLTTIERPGFYLVCVKRANDDGEIPVVGVY